MWRTSAIILLVSLAFANAIQNLDKIQFAAGQPIQDKGPIQETKAEEPQHDDSTFMKAFRFMRSNAVPGALNAIGLGQGNQFADQKYYTIPTSGETVTLTIGQAVNFTTQFTLRNDVFFVYGKASCTDSKCRKTAVPHVFDESKGTADTTMPNTFKYDKFGSASGSNYKTSITFPFKDSPSIDAVIGVATAGDVNNDIVSPPAEAYVGLGFAPESGPTYNTIKTILNAVAPSRALTIWRDTDLKEGVIYLGSTSYSKCPKKQTDLRDIQQDKNKVLQWWIKADKIEAGDKNVTSPIVKVSLDETEFGLPKDLYDKITGSLDKTQMIDDPSKLPTIKLTIGKDVIKLDGKAYTTKMGDKQFFARIVSTEKSEYDVVLSQLILTQACIVLQQNDEKGSGYKLGLIYSENSFSTSSMTFSFGLIMLPLVYLLGL